jgi:hypothetical protein
VPNHVLHPPELQRMQFVEARRLDRVRSRHGGGFPNDFSHFNAGSMAASGVSRCSP